MIGIMVPFPTLGPFLGKILYLVITMSSPLRFIQNTPLAFLLWQLHIYSHSICHTEVCLPSPRSDRLMDGDGWSVEPESQRLGSANAYMSQRFWSCECRWVFCKTAAKEVSKSALRRNYLAKLRSTCHQTTLCHSGVSAGSFTADTSASS